MSVFKAVKQSVTTRQAAVFYGINVRRNGMACCIFHADKTPSMKVDNRYHCFGCQADGDVIDFTGHLFGISCKEAADKLAADFGVSYNNYHREVLPPVKRKLSSEQELQRKVKLCYRVLCDYLHLLNHWKEIHAPQRDDEDWHPLFIEALQKEELVKYQLDILWEGTIEEKIQLANAREKDVTELEERIRNFTRQQQESKWERRKRAFDLAR